MRSCLLLAWYNFGFFLSAPGVLRTWPSMTFVILQVSSGCRFPLSFMRQKIRLLAIFQLSTSNRPSVAFYPPQTGPPPFLLPQERTLFFLRSLFWAISKAKVYTAENTPFLEDDWKWHAIRRDWEPRIHQSVQSLFTSSPTVQDWWKWRALCRSHHALSATLMSVWEILLGLLSARMIIEGGAKKFNEGARANADWGLKGVSSTLQHLQDETVGITGLGINRF